MNLLESTTDLIEQPMMLPKYVKISEESPSLMGGKKPKEEKKKSKPKKEKKEKKVKLIDTFLKTKLEKIAKKHDVSLKTRDGKIKTKEQLFNSLKRKNLI
jgi:hypothetical protein